MGKQGNSIQSPTCLPDRAAEPIRSTTRSPRRSRPRDEDDKAFKAKQAADKKAREEMAKKAGGKGPLTTGGIKKSGEALLSLGKCSHLREERDTQRSSVSCPYKEHGTHATMRLGAVGDRRVVEADAHVAVVVALV